MAETTLSALSLPPREAIEFLRQKTNVTTERWTDVWREQHSRSFMVAGAATDALVADFRTEVARALEQGTTLAEFRRQFDAIVRKHGWEYNGSPGWRSRIIYETNLSTAYSAGRYAQMTEPDTLAAFPFWQYVHSGSAHPRKQHLAWNGLTLRADDGFWATHYPPNGWRCGCRVRPLSARALQRQGKSGPDRAPDIETWPWTNPRTGEVSQVPVGIDPGFDYNPGLAWRGPPRVPGDAVLRAPPGTWPPPAPEAARPMAMPPIVRRAPPPPAVQQQHEQLRAAYAPWWQDLSSIEREAVRLYRRAGPALNAVLRGQAAATPQIDAAIAGLRQALAQAVAPGALVVRRGASVEEIAALARGGGGFDAFVSTSIDAGIAADFAARRGGGVIEIRIPAGARGVAYIQPWPTPWPAQYEVLIAAGTRYRVVRRSRLRLVLEIVDV